jgi:hypothetical protein
MTAPKSIKPSLVLLGALVLFFGVTLVPWHGQFLGGSDIAKLFYWLASFTREQCLSGSLPLWNPYYYAGHPLIGLPSSALFYPSTLLFVLLSLPWAFNLDLLLHLFLAGYGMFRLVELLTGRRAAGLTAALAYMLSGYFMDRLAAGHLTQIHSAAWLPWVFYLLERALESRRPRHYLLCGAVLGMQILAGEPQNSFYALLFAALYGVIRAGMQTGGKLRPALRAGWRLALVPLVAFGLAAVQIIPALEFAGLSDRAARTYEFASGFSFPPANFLTLLIPNVQASRILLDPEYGGYLGCLSLLLAAAALVSPAHRQRALPFLALLLLAVSLMVGEYTVLYRIYYGVIPGLGLFRVPARAMVMLVLAGAVLAGLGADALLRGALPDRRRHWLLGAWLALALGLPWLSSWAGGARFSPPVWQASLWMIGGAAAVGLVARWGTRAWAARLFPLVLLGDLTFCQQGKIPRLDEHELVAREPYEAMFSTQPGGYRVLSPFHNNRGMLHHYANLNAYTPIVVGQYYNFLHDMAQVAKPQNGRNRLGVAYFSEPTVFSSRILGVQHAVIPLAEGKTQVLVDDHPMPRAVLVYKAREIAAYINQIARLRDPGFDPQAEVILEVPPPLPAVPGKGKAEVAQYAPNRIAVKTQSDQPGYLVLSELFYPGWEATVDGKAAPILKADCILRAVVLDKGAHEVIFKYRPRSLMLGAAGSAGTVALLLAAFLRARRRDDLSASSGMEN